MKALLLSALLFVTPMIAHADEDAPKGITCESAVTDFKFAVKRYNLLVDDFKATDDQHEKAIIYIEGEPLKDLMKFLQGWYKENCKDI